MSEATSTRPVLSWRFLGRFWEAALDLGTVLFPMRFPIIVLIVSSLLLLLVQQAQDALYVLVAGSTNRHSDAIFRLIIFGVCTFLWAFNSFYAARFMSRLPPRGRAERIATFDAKQNNQTHLYPPPLVQARWIADLNLHLPRWIGALVIIAVDASLLRASWRLGFEVKLALIFSGVVMLAFYRYLVRNRRKVIQKLFKHRVRLSRVFEISDGLERDLGSVQTLPRWCRRLVLMTVLIIFAILLSSSQVDLQIVYLRLWIGLATLGCLAVGLVVLGQSRGIPYSTKWFVSLQLVLIGGMFILSLVPQAQLVTNVFGSPAVVVLAAACWAFGGTLLIAYPTEITRLPILLGLVMLAIGFGLIGKYDNHVIRKTQRSVARSFVSDVPSVCRRLSPAAGADGTQRGKDTDPFAHAFERWCDVAATQWGQDGRIPLVIVAAAGGASRAAYWTEKVLAELEQYVPGFHNYVFAISSVSGGTLGSAAYRLSLDLQQPKSQSEKPILRGADCTSFVIGDNPAPCMLAMLQRDFLSSLILGALYSDLVQRFLPGALLPDRGGALESSWERAWRSFFPNQPDWMEEGLLSRTNAFLATPKVWRPLLLFNGASALTGRRVITSNLPVDGHFSDSIDFFGWVSQDPSLSQDIPISTAIHNSARFPYLDAAGDVIIDGNVVDRIVDGGYFENYGAATALDVLEQLIDRGAVGSLSQDASGRIGERTIDPIIIQISNDAEVPPRLPLGSDASAPKKPLPVKFRVLADAFTPPTAFYDMRNGLGQRATDVLRTRLAYLREGGTNDARYFHFQIADKNVPMSWLLSDYAGALIDRQLPLGKQDSRRDPADNDKDARRFCNVEEFGRLVGLLHGDVSQDVTIAGRLCPHSSQKAPSN